MKLIKKKKSLSKLENDLWKVFSKFIRLRDADSNGYCQCITCGFTYHWKQMQAGHYWPKGSCKYLKFNEYNVNAQCARCNKWGQGEQVKHRAGIVKKHSEDIARTLDDTRHFPAGFTREGLVMRIQEYVEKVKKLEREKL